MVIFHSYQRVSFYFGTESKPSFLLRRRKGRLFSVGLAVFGRLGQVLEPCACRWSPNFGGSWIFAPLGMILMFGLFWKVKFLIAGFFLLPPRSINDVGCFKNGESEFLKMASMKKWWQSIQIRDIYTYIHYFKFSACCDLEDPHCSFPAWNPENMTVNFVSRLAMDYRPVTVEAPPKKGVDQNSTIGWLNLLVNESWTEIWSSHMSSTK